VQAKSRFNKRLSRALRIVNNASTATGRLANQGPKKARVVIQGLIKDVERGIAKGRVDPTAGTVLLNQLQSALDNLQPLIKRR
jgi:hypothetical protein